MRAVVQRVKHSSVTVNDKVVGKINKGLMVLLGITHTDGDDELTWIVNKILKLRIFADDEGKMNKSLLDINGEILIISQFTLYGDCKKGLRPGFSEAAKPDHAIPLYEKFIKKTKEFGIKVETGIFGADMKVELLNDGPVTMIVEK